MLLHRGLAVWDSLAIAEYLNDLKPEAGLWPPSAAARAHARSISAEMHSSFAALRRQCPMNIRRQVEGWEIDDDARDDVVRVLTLWAEARARFGRGGPFLFGTFSAADIFYAPVVSRFLTYGIAVPGFALAYMEAVWEHDWLQTWVAAAAEEEWVIEQWEMPGRPGGTK